MRIMKAFDLNILPYPLIHFFFIATIVDIV